MAGMPSCSMVTRDEIGLQRLEWLVTSWTSANPGLRRAGFLRQLRRKDVLPPDELEVSIDGLKSQATWNCLGITAKELGAQAG